MREYENDETSRSHDTEILVACCAFDFTRIRLKAVAAWGGRQLMVVVGH